MKSKLSFALAALPLLASLGLNADVSLPRVFSNNMVLQQQTRVNIWGSANPGETVNVTGSWNDATVSTQADSSGEWMAQLSTIAGDSEGTPYTLTVQGNNTLTYTNVVMGEVWILGGQSNMELPLGGWGDDTPVEGGEAAIAAADLPNLRLLMVGTSNASSPQNDFANHWAGSGWRASSSATSRNFSALGFFFGREILDNLQVPVGLIQCCWGGSTCETWLPKYALNRVEEYNGEGPWEATTYPNDGITDPDNDNHTPSVCYNAMVHPLIPFTLRGALWYQGETNMGRAEELSQLFPEMIQAWRHDWGQDSLPFCFALLAPWDYWPGQLPGFWESQASALFLPETGMVVTQDVGNLANIHPAKKEPVGHRMALWARAQVYGEDIVYSGPIYRSMTVEGSTIRLSFDHIGTGLKASEDGLEYFEIAGSDGVFVPATANIDGDDVIVSSDSVSEPTQARYGWSKEAVSSLFNQEDLPAAPFRTQPADYTLSHFGAFIRPDDIGSDGLYAQNGKLHDASNESFVPYGIAMEIDAAADNAIEDFHQQFDEITSLSLGNSLAVLLHLGEEQTVDNLAEQLQEILFTCVQADITPIINLRLPEGSDASDEAELWTEPAILEIINRFEDYAAIYYYSAGLVNTENWSTQVNTDLATLRSRNGGTQILVLVEGPEEGDDPDSLIEQCPSITATNLAFSIVPIFDFIEVSDIDEVLDALMAQGIPSVFSGVAPYPNGNQLALAETLMGDCVERDVGFILSMWKPLDENEDASIRASGDEAALSSSWGQTAILGDYGVNNTAQTAAFFAEPMVYDSWTALCALENSENAFEDDPDGDGLSNKMEYFHALNPTRSEKQSYRAIKRVAGENIWSMRVNDDAKDAWSATILVSPDMKTWTEGTLNYWPDQGEWRLYNTSDSFPALKSATLANGIWTLQLEASSGDIKFSKYEVNWIFDLSPMDN